MARLHPDPTLRRIPQREGPALSARMDAYLAETARYRQRPVGPVSAAGYRYLPLYWTERTRHPFFIEFNGAVAGFALVRELLEESAPATELAEFYVEPASRRAGVGGRAAREVWRRFPGRWQLQVALGNRPAAAFWARCIADAASGPVCREPFPGEDGPRLRYRFAVEAGDGTRSRPAPDPGSP